MSNKSILNFSVECSEENGVIIAKIICDKPKPIMQYAFYLYDVNNNILKKQMYIKENFFSFAVEGKGNYYVKGFVRYKNNEKEEFSKISQNSNKILIFSMEERQDFFEFLNTPSKVNLPDLEFFKLTKPFSDMLFIYSKDLLDNNLIKKVATENKLNYNNIPINSGFSSILTGENIIKENEDLMHFSGISRTDTNLVFGMEDVNSIETANSISTQIGEFILFRKQDNIVTIETDYFGISKLYYYQNDDVFIVSNRTHLLLTLLYKLNVKFHLNYDKVYAYLSINNQLGMQNFSRELNICGLVALPIDSKIVVDYSKNKIEVVKTEIYDILTNIPQYDKYEYERLLKVAALELIDNAKIVFENEKFDNIVAHITGGLDSRLVYCALTQFPEYMHKIIPHTTKSDAEPTNFDTALKVLSKTNICYSKIPKENEVRNHISIYDSLSYCLGVGSGYFSKSSPRFINSCILGGAYGEIVARPIYARLRYGTFLDNDYLNVEEFAGYLTNLNNINFVYNSKIYYKKELTEELEKLPGRTSLEKLENHYLYYRNRIHFDNTLNILNHAPYFGVLQSKTLFKLKYMSLPIHNNIKLQLDIMYQLNPELASVMYDSKKDEDERVAINTACYSHYTIAQNYDKDVIENLENLWNNAQENDTSSYKIPNIPDPLTDENILSILYYLIQSFGFKNEFAKYIYNYVKNAKRDNSKIYFYRKMLSLYYETKFIIKE